MKLFENNVLMGIKTSKSIRRILLAESSPFYILSQSTIDGWRCPSLQFLVELEVPPDFLRFLRQFQKRVCLGIPFQRGENVLLHQGLDELSTIHGIKVQPHLALFGKDPDRNPLHLLLFLSMILNQDIQLPSSSILTALAREISDHIFNIQKFEAFQSLIQAIGHDDNMDGFNVVIYRLMRRIMAEGRCLEQAIQFRCLIFECSSTTTTRILDEFDQEFRLWAPENVSRVIQTIKLSEPLAVVAVRQWTIQLAIGLQAKRDMSDTHYLSNIVDTIHRANREQKIQIFNGSRRVCFGLAEYALVYQSLSMLSRHNVNVIGMTDEIEDKIMEIIEQLFLMPECENLQNKMASVVLYIFMHKSVLGDTNDSRNRASIVLVHLIEDGDKCYDLFNRLMEAGVDKACIESITKASLIFKDFVLVAEVSAAKDKNEEREMPLWAHIAVQYWAIKTTSSLEEAKKRENALYLQSFFTCDETCPSQEDIAGYPTRKIRNDSDDETMCYSDNDT